MDSKTYLMQLGITPELANNNSHPSSSNWYYSYKLPSKVTSEFLHDLAHLLQFKKRESHYWLNNTGRMIFPQSRNGITPKGIKREREVAWIDKTYLQKLKVKNLKLQKKYNKRWFKTKIQLVNKLWNHQEEVINASKSKIRVYDTSSYQVLLDPLKNSTIQMIIEDYTKVTQGIQITYSLKDNESLTEIIELTSKCNLQTHIVDFDPIVLTVVF